MTKEEILKHLEYESYIMTCDENELEILIRLEQEGLVISIAHQKDHQHNHCFNCEYTYVLREKEASQCTTSHPLSAAVL